MSTARIFRTESGSGIPVHSPTMRLYTSIDGQQADSGKLRSIQRPNAPSWIPSTSAVFSARGSSRGTWSATASSCWACTAGTCWAPCASRSSSSASAGALDLSWQPSPALRLEAEPAASTLATPAWELAASRGDRQDARLGWELGPAGFRLRSRLSRTEDNLDGRRKEQAAPALEGRALPLRRRQLPGFPGEHGAVQLDPPLLGFPGMKQQRGEAQTTA